MIIAPLGTPPRMSDCECSLLSFNSPSTNVHTRMLAVYRKKTKEGDFELTSQDRRFVDEFMVNPLGFNRAILNDKLLCPRTPKTVEDLASGLHMDDKIVGGYRERFCSATNREKAKSLFVSCFLESRFELDKDDVKSLVYLVSRS